MSFILRYFLLLIKIIYVGKISSPISFCTRVYISLFSNINMLLNKYFTPSFCRFLQVFFVYYDRVNCKFGSPFK